MKRIVSGLLALLLALTLAVPGFEGEARAAATEKEEAKLQKSEDVIPARPGTYDLFFDSAKEAYSFNTATYWDVYQEDLGILKDGKGSNGDNAGLVLTSSTDAGLVRKGAVTDESSTGSWTGTLEVTGWGTFTAGDPFAEGQKILTFEGVKLKAGTNDIAIACSADVRALRVKDSTGTVRTVVMPKANENVQSAKRADENGSDQSPVTKDKDWIEAVSGATFKEGDGCIGWTSEGKVIYHLVSSQLEEGTYTIEVEYAWGNAGVEAGATATANEGVSTGLKGALRIDYETSKAFTYEQYAPSGTSTTAFNYSDGSGTVVGWGGSFDKYHINNVHKPAKYLAVTMKQVNGPEMDQVLRYLTMYLVNSGGKVLAALDGNGYEKSYPNAYADGYETYIYGPIAATAEDDGDVQGIKLVFERGNNQADISGSIELAYLGICINDSYDTTDTGSWIDFSPFNYDMATINSFEDNADHETRKPFLRPNERTDRHTIAAEVTGKKATIAGYNISTAANYDWHAWTVSTSDANIVDANHGSHNGTGSFNALEIKYQNTEYHTTYARLTGSAERVRKGQWLAITMKAEDLKSMTGTSYEDLENIRIVLKNGEDELKRIPLGDFRSACTADAPAIDEEDLRQGYRTLFYDLGVNAAITTVEFDFSQVQNAGAGEDTHRIYVKDIYLFTPELTIEKAVDREVATAGETLEYTLTVKNSSAGDYSQDFTVTDTLPGNLTYVEGSSRVKGPDGTALDVTPTQNGQTLTWSFRQNLGEGEAVTITFRAKIPEGTEHGTVYNNLADVNGVSSNPVRTTVWDAEHSSLVFYAQVGLTTTLTLDLGNDTFAGLGNRGTGFEVTTESTDGEKNPGLDYRAQPAMAGKISSFFVNVYPNGDGTAAKQKVLVTVYNYDVQDHLYVLDYGLPVYLTNNKTEGETLADFAGTGLFGGGAADTLRFMGLSKTLGANDNGIADQGEYAAGSDYKIPDSSTGTAFSNGRVTSDFTESGYGAHTMKYTPTRFLDSVDTFYYGVQVVKTGTTGALDATCATPVMEGTIRVVPASVLYYEDNFAKGEGVIRYGENTSTEGTDQTAQRVQSNDIGLRYGYDEAYGGDSAYSGGSATKMEPGNYAVFQFKGTGVDIISSTTTDTGTLFLYVYDNAKIAENGTVTGTDENTKPTLVAAQLVNTYYENNGETGLYQIPVISVRGLEGDKNHVVKLLVSKVRGKAVFLDGLRIYDPLGQEGDQYYLESEKKTQVLELRSMILGTGYSVSYDGEGKTSMTLTPGQEVKASLVQYGDETSVFYSGGTVTENFTGAYYNNNEGASQDTAMTDSMVSYLLQGPNNEVYLSGGYGLAFYTDGIPEENATLQVEARALSGSPVLQYRGKDGQWADLVELNTATEMYYEIPLDSCEKDNEGKALVALRVDPGNDGVVSLTNLKASAAMTFTPVSAQDALTQVEIDHSGIETVREPGANGRRIITFATNGAVVDVQVYAGDAKVECTAASYVFREQNTKTWIVAYDASLPGTYSLRLVTPTGAEAAILNNRGEGAED